MRYGKDSALCQHLQMRERRARHYCAFDGARFDETCGMARLFACEYHFQYQLIPS
jgi:hypothetical protein